MQFYTPSRHHLETEHHHLPPVIISEALSERARTDSRPLHSGKLGGSQGPQSPLHSGELGGSQGPQSPLHSGELHTETMSSSTYIRTIILSD